LNVPEDVLVEPAVEVGEPDEDPPVIVEEESPHLVSRDNNDTMALVGVPLGYI